MFNDILIFLKIVETGSFTKAAYKLGTTQATVSRRIQELERNLGIELIKRNTRQIEVTSMGLNLYEKLKDTEQHVNNVIDELKNSTGAPVGTLRVSLATAMAYNVISPNIPHFLRKNPGITLEVYYESQPADLYRSPFDIAIVAEKPKQQSLLAKKLTTINLKLYCTPQYVEKYGMPKAAEDLQGHMLLGALFNDYTTNKQAYLKNPKTGEVKVIDWKSRIYINSGLHSISMTKSGEIIGAAWDGLVKE